MYEIDMLSRSKGFKAMPMRTPRKTPEKVMTKRRFSFNHDLKLAKVVLLISGFNLNLPGSEKQNELNLVKVLCTEYTTT